MDLEQFKLVGIKYLDEPGGEGTGKVNLDGYCFSPFEEMAATNGADAQPSRAAGAAASQQGLSHVSPNPENEERYKTTSSTTGRTCYQPHSDSQEPTLAEKANTGDDGASGGLPESGPAVDSLHDDDGVSSRQVLTLLTLLVDLFAVGCLCTMALDATECPLKMNIAACFVLPGILFDLCNVFWIRSYLQAKHDCCSADRLPQRQIFFARTVEFWLGLFQAEFALTGAVTFCFYAGGPNTTCAQSPVVIASLLLSATYCLSVLFDLCTFASRYTLRFMSRDDFVDPEHAWFQYFDYLLMRSAGPVLLSGALVITALAGEGANRKCENVSAAKTMAGLFVAAMLCDTFFTEQFDDWASRAFCRGTPSSAAAVGGSVVFCVSAWIVAVGVDLFSSCSSALLVEDVTILVLLTIGTAIGVFKVTTTSTTSTTGVGGAPSREEAAPLLLI